MILFAVCYLTRPLTRSYREWAILPQCMGWAILPTPWSKMAQMAHFLYWLNGKFWLYSIRVITFSNEQRSQNTLTRIHTLHHDGRQLIESLGWPFCPTLPYSCLLHVLVYTISQPPFNSLPIFPFPHTSMFCHTCSCSISSVLIFSILFIPTIHLNYGS